MKSVESKIKSIIDKHKVPGTAFAVIENKEIKFCSIIGAKNFQTGKVIVENTIFEAASLSKSVFAYGCFKLIRKNLLDLDQPLSKYLEYDYVKNDRRIRDITARMVLTHTTGFPNWRPKNQKLAIVYKSGERFSYSGEGFLYLQKTIEKILSQPIEEYMLHNVFSPIGMTNSSYMWSADYEYIKSCGHDTECNIVKAREKFAPNVAYTLHTTILDYAKFIQKILSEDDVIEQILSQKITIYDKNDHLHKINSVFWGLGWGLQVVNRNILLWQWGDTRGFKSYVAISSTDKTAIIVFTNSDNGLKAIPNIVEYLSGINHPIFEVLHKI